MKSTASESPEYLFHPKIPRKSQLLFYYLQGEFSLDKKKLDWEPRVKFEALVEIMVKEDLQRWQKWLKGERFPWDAPNYPSENKILSRMWRLER